MNIVVMATYNGNQFIIKQLESIKNQTQTIDKVIIVDDCSKDNSYELIENFIQQYNLNSWKLLKNESNLGHYRTFLKGLREIGTLNKDDFVFLSDQDDIWHSNKIEELTKAFFSQDNVTMVSCKSEFIDERDKILYSDSYSGEYIQQTQFDILKKWPSGYQMGLRGDILSMALEEKIEHFDGFQYHDVLLAFFYSLYGKQIVVDKVLDQHRLHRTNVTKRISKNGVESKENILRHFDVCISRVESILNYAREKQLSTNTLDNFIKFFKLRKKFVSEGNLFDKVYLLLKFRSFYERKKLILRDIFYAYIYTVYEKLK